MLLDSIFAWVAAWVFAVDPAGPAAPTETEEVAWSAPPGCPDRGSLLAGIVRRRGRALAPGEVRVQARIEADAAQRYRLEIELQAGARRESRTVTAETCAALVDAAALLIVLVVDGPASSSGEARPTDAAARLEPHGGEPEAAPATQAAGRAQVVGEPSPSPDVARSVAPTPRRRTGGFLRVQGGAEVGALPGPTGSVALGAGLLWRHVRLELQATYLGPRTTDGVQPAVRASLVAGSLLGCARLGQGALEFSPCAGLEPGLLRGVETATGAARPGRWLAVLVTAGAAWRVHPRFALWGGLVGVLAVQRPSFQLRESKLVLFAPPVASIRLVLGLELRFGDPR